MNDLGMIASLSLEQALGDDGIDHEEQKLNEMDNDWLCQTSLRHMLARTREKNDSNSN
jgi:hypothetical protein